LSVVRAKKSLLEGGEPSRQNKAYARFVAESQEGPRSSVPVARSWVGLPNSPGESGGLVSELAVRYLEHVKTSNVHPTHYTHCKTILQDFLLPIYSDLPVNSFGPKCLITVRNSMVASKRLCRNLVNDYVRRIVAMFSFGVESVECEVKQGTIDDAREYACSANSRHGLPRTPEDKRKAVEVFFKIPGRDDLSNSEVAKKVGVSVPFVKKVRDELGVKASPAAHYGKGSETYKEERLNDLIPKSVESNASEEGTGLNDLIPATTQKSDKTVNVELPIGKPHDFVVALIEHFDPKYLKLCTKCLVDTFKLT